MLGHHRPASETPFKWRFAGGPMMALFKCYLDPLCPHRKKKKKKKKKKKLVRVGPPLAKFSGSAPSMDAASNMMKTSVENTATGE